MFHPRGPTFFELARQALSSTERGYDLLAPKFDRTPFRTPDAVLDAAAAILAETGGVDSALDLCCGTGAAMVALRPLCGRRIVGVDFSRGMLAEARRRLDAAAARPGLAPAKLVQADVLDLDFDGDFDLVTCFGALGHFRRRDHDRLIATVARALKPGGRFVFATAERPPPWSWRLWAALAFNAAMAIRNAVWRPTFVMYYLRFLLPEVRRRLRHHGLEVTVHRSPVPSMAWLHLAVAELLRPGAEARRNNPPELAVVPGGGN